VTRFGVGSGHGSAAESRHDRGHGHIGGDVQQRLKKVRDLRRRCSGKMMPCRGIPRANNSGIRVHGADAGNAPASQKLKMKTPITKAAKEAGSSETPKR